MNIYDFTDDEAIKALKDYEESFNNEVLQKVAEYPHDLALKISNCLSMEDKLKFAKGYESEFTMDDIPFNEIVIKEPPIGYEDHPPIKETYEESVLMETYTILELIGCHNLAKQIYRLYATSKVKNTLEVSADLMEVVINGIVKKSRSKAASGPRHHLHDEIVAIMKATWKKEPALSKTRMIEKLSRRYEGQISEETIKCWIKSEKLAPPAPHDKKYKDAELVIPPEYA
ncbi:UNVERIFIED_CONTAM: hypothetical protein DQE83_25395 [Escherichia coli]